MDFYVNSDPKKIKERNTILTVARVERRKNLWVLLNAIDKLKMKMGNIRLQVVGGIEKVFEPELERMKAFVHHKALERNVEFLGYVDHHLLLKAYQDARVFALSSIEESSPVSLAQALAAGLPCVVSNIEGHQHLVQDDVNGYLVHPNDPDGFAFRFEQLFKSDELWSRLSNASRERAQELRVDAIAARHLKVFEDLIAERGT